MMVNWFKRDRLLQGMLILLTPIFIGIFIIVGLFVYDVVQLSDPNYIENGPRVALYKEKSCIGIEFEKGVFDFHTPCFLVKWWEGMYKNSTKTLDKVVKSAANEKEYVFFKRLAILDGYPKKGTEWNCSSEGKLILDNTTEIIQPVLYKCWPK